MERPAGNCNEADFLVVSTGETSHCLNAGGMGRIDYETETLVTHALTRRCSTAEEDGTGRGAPLVPMWIPDVYPALSSNEGGTLTQIPPIAFSCKDHGADAGEISPTLRAMEFDKSHANAGGQVAVATFDPRNVTSKANRTKVEFGSPANTLHEKGMSIIGSAVRRLTPLECERLQGFPDGYTAVPYRGKLAADGPRYKALGNSMAVPVMAWIGRRIINACEVSE